MDSPNFNARPPRMAIDLLVIHNISLPPKVFGGGYIEQFFLNRLDSNAHPYFKTIEGLEVSAHCLVDRHAKVTQFVSFDQRAWHAGVSNFLGREQCNDFSIGIELEGADDCPYSSEQYSCLVELTRQIMNTYPGITLDRIVGHCDIAPGRKTDPGPAFQWDRYLSLLKVS